MTPSLGARVNGTGAPPPIGGGGVDDGVRLTPALAVDPSLRAPASAPDSHEILVASEIIASPMSHRTWATHRVNGAGPSGCIVASGVRAGYALDSTGQAWFLRVVAAMGVFHGIEEFGRTLDRCVLTIGNFDGVHRAHQQLVARAAQLASTAGGDTVALTFEPHPLCVVAPDKAPPRLTSLDEKLRLLEEAGADVVVVAPSKPELLSLEAPEFVRAVICERFHPACIVEGPSFGFGKGRRGSPQTLVDMATELDFEVHILDPIQLEIDGARQMVSSSLVRKLLTNGEVMQAAACLGRSYALSGTVVRGAGRGRKLGFPTANLCVPDQLVPADGVYVGSVQVGPVRYDTAVSIGTTPTFDGRQRLVELHLLEFEGDLYDQAMRVELSRTLRKQRKFDSPDQLIEQLHRDVEQVRKLAETDTHAG